MTIDKFHNRYSLNEEARRWDQANNMLRISRISKRTKERVQVIAYQAADEL